MCAKIKGLLPSSLRLRIDQMYENIGVGSFSILGYWGGGGANPGRSTPMLGGIAKSIYTHACTCTCMTIHVLNIHTPMHACTRMYVCMHSLCNVHFILI